MTTTELESPKTEQLTVRPVAQPSPNATGAPHPHPYPPMQPIILAAPGGNAPYTIAMPGSAAEPPRQIVSLEEVFAWVARRWKLGAVCGALLAAAVLVFMLGRTPFYSSSASLIVRAREEKVFGFDPVVDNTLENHSAPFILNNHRAEMQTRKFREFLYGYLPEDIRAAFLAEPENPPIVSRSIAFAKKLVKGERDLSDEAVRKDAFVMALEDRAAVDFVKETYIINVAITHHDQALAPRLANAYIDAYLKYAADQDQETNREASAFLRRQADELARKVEHSEQELADYRKKEGLVQDDARQDLSAEKMKVLNGELTRAELDLSKVRRTLAQVAEAGGDTEALLSIDAIAAAPGIGALRAQLTDKLREKAAVDARYGELHPKHTEFYQGFNTLVAETRTAIGRVVGEHENRAAALEREVASLAGSLASTEDAVLDQGDRSVHLRMLQRQLDTDRELYNKISVRLNEASVSSEFGESRSLRQVDVAAPAEKPTRPNKPAAVLLSGFSFAAMFVGLPIALGGLETFRRLREKVGGAGESDPAPEGAPATRRDMPDASLPALQAPHPGAAMLAKAPGGGEATALLAAPPSPGQPPASPTPATAAASGTLHQFPYLGELMNVEEAAAGRILSRLFREGGRERANLEGIASALAARSSAGVAEKRVILVSSVRRSEGKSLLSVALAGTYGLRGTTTVVIDANLRDPSIHNWLNGGAGMPGLSDLLTASTAPHFDLSDYRCSGSPLYALPAGFTSDDPAALLPNPRFDDILREAQEIADVIIIDTPAIDFCSDALALAPYATEIVLAWDANSTTEAELFAASREFTRHGAPPKCAGAVLNAGA